MTRSESIGMRWSGGLVLPLLWLAGGLAWLAWPPAPPPPFPEPGHELIPARRIYDPVLGASVNQILRDYWQKPDQLLEALGDLDGLEVADIGCGEGYFTLRLLELVGEHGKVYATDIQKPVLDLLAARIPGKLMNRARLILSSEEEIGLSHPVDLIFLVQVLGEVPQQREFLLKLQSLLRPQGRLVLIDSRHITDPEGGYTRPINQVHLLGELRKLGFEPAPGYLSGAEFLPKQFFYVLVPKSLPAPQESRNVTPSYVP